MSDPKPSEATTGEPSAAIRDLCGAHGQQTRPTHSCICLKLLTVRYAERERLRAMVASVPDMPDLMRGAAGDTPLTALMLLVADLRAGKEER